jgi:hypothetical protein
MRRVRGTIAAALLSSAIVIGFSTWFVNKYFWIEAHSVIARFWPPPTAEQVEQKQLRRIAGWSSLDCGHVHHRGDAGPAISCALQALESGRRFYVAFDYVGLDSHGTIGLALNAQGVLYEVDTDQMGGGWGGYVCCGRRISEPQVRRCKKAPTEQSLIPRIDICHAFPTQLSSWRNIPISLRTPVIMSSSGPSKSARSPSSCSNSVWLPERRKACRPGRDT